MSKLKIRDKYLIAALLPAASMVLTWTAGRKFIAPHPLVSISVAMSVCVGAVAAIKLANSVIRRIETLAGAVNLISEGLAVTSLDSSQDELALLSSAMVHMSHQVLSQKAALIDFTASLEAVLRATADVSILAEDLEGRITISNTGAERLLGYRPGELKGRKLNEVTQSQASEQTRAAVQQARNSARRDAAEELETLYVRRDGQALQVQLSVTPLKDRGAKLIGFLHVAHDITHRKVLESELRQKNEELKGQQFGHATQQCEAAALERLREVTVEPLANVHRSLVSLQNHLKNESEKQLVEDCRVLTESVLSSVRSATAEQSAGELAEAMVPLPQFVDAASARMSPKAGEPAVALKQINNWYEEKGDIPSPLQKRSTRGRILIVDDFEATRALMRAYLQDLKYDLDFAGDGEEALQKIAEDNYSLVLMDIEMPKMTGHETARHIRVWERDQNRPPLRLIAMSAHAGKDFDPADAALWNSSLSKPLSKGQLLREVEKHLKAA